MLLNKFLRLPRGYRRTLLASFLALLLTRLGLITLRYKRLRRIVPTASTEAPPELLVMLGWCIPRAAKHIAGASCLTQALAMQLMLARKGYAAELRVGARREETGQFVAHAWLLSNGRVVLGGDEAELARYSTFTRFSASPR